MCLRRMRPANLLAPALRRLAIVETDRFPKLGRALYANGLARAIAGLAAALQRWVDRGFLVLDDPMVEAHPVQLASDGRSRKSGNVFRHL